MKFVKSKFAQKLIIILIALMIFNIAIPQEVKAWDLGGILLKPISSLILSTLVSIDVSIGILLNGLSIGVNAIGGIIEIFTEDNTDALNDISTALNQLFIGPDTIFAGKVRILDANIFEVESFTSPTDFFDTIISSGLVENVNELSDATSPGYNLIVNLKQGIATVYRVLRDICGYIMLAGLIFTGIRILVSSNIPTKKTQYLMLLQDWLIGMVLLIFSHVIMVGVFYISDTLVEALSLSLNGLGGLNFNLIVQCLLSFDSAEQIICLVMLGYLIYLTVIFGISYLKRLMWICVLIVIAPIVSVMYAFGNSTKGIYTKWIREYIMTVFVQPFHLIVYYVLVSIPLNMSNSTVGFSLTGSNFLEIVYCLVAISFIRPAEKYIRELFGMHQGIVSQASFDSGKQTFDVAKKAIATVALTATTAGIGPAFMGALKGGAALKGIANASKGVLGDGGKLLSRIFNGNPKNAAIDTGYAVKEEEGQQAGSASAANAFQYSDNPVLDAQREALAEQLADGQIDKKDLTNEQKALLGIDNNPKPENKTDIDKKNGDQNSNTENLSPDQILERAKLRGQLDRKEISEKDLTNVQKDLLGFNNENKDINEEELEKANEMSQEAGDKLSNAADKLSDAADKLSQQNDLQDEDMEIQKGVKNDKKESEDSNEPKGWREKVGDFVEGKADNMSDFMKLAVGDKGVFETLSEMDSNSKLGQVAGQFMDSDLGKSLKKFEELGGMQELHKGFNEVRDTFYVTAPPQDWKTTNERMENRRKEHIEQEKFNFTHNEGNQQFIINQKKYLEKFRAQYPDKVKYPDAYIQNLAKEKAKSDLKSLADTYVPLGVTDVKGAYQCEEDRKNYGLTSTESVQLMADFERFNKASDNIVNLNVKHGESYTTVSEGIPHAREYYNNGYKDINQMMWVDAMAMKLKDMPQFKKKETKNTEHQFAMKIDQELRKKGGKVNYKGKDENIKEFVKDLNEYYQKQQ